MMGCCQCHSSWVADWWRVVRLVGNHQGSRINKMWMLPVVNVTSECRLLLNPKCHIFLRSRFLRVSQLFIYVLGRSALFARASGYVHSLHAYSRTHACGVQSSTHEQFGFLLLVRVIYDKIRLILKVLDKFSIKIF